MRRSAISHSLVTAVRQATQAIHKVLEERGYHNDYVFCGAIAQDLYGDTSKPPSRVDVLFLKPTHTLSLKQLIPNFNPQNFVYTRLGGRLQWRSGPTADPSVDIIFTPPFSTYNKAERQIIEGFPLPPYPYLILQTLWVWGQISAHSTDEQTLNRDLLSMLHFLQQRSHLQRPIFFDKILKSASAPVVDRFYAANPSHLGVWQSLGFLKGRQGPPRTSPQTAASTPSTLTPQQAANRLTNGGPTRGATTGNGMPMPNALVNGHLPKPSPSSSVAQSRHLHVARAGTQSPPTALRQNRKKKKGKYTFFEIRHLAAGVTTTILSELGFQCALFGSMACRLYGNRRLPNDIDMLVMPPPDRAEITQEEVKALLVDHCPPEYHFVMLKPRDPEATYRVLYFIPKPRPPDAHDAPSQSEEPGEPQGENEEAIEEELAEAVGDLTLQEGVDAEAEGTETTEGLAATATTAETQGAGGAADKKPRAGRRPGLFSSSKVDILLPGIMNLPSLSPKLITYKRELPCVPYPVLVAQKLQGWSDHCASEEERFQAKVPVDMADIEWCLGQGAERNWRPWEKYGPRIWSDRRMFSEEVEALTRERVVAICQENPRMVAGWQGLGLLI